MFNDAQETTPTTKTQGISFKEMLNSASLKAEDSSGLRSVLPSKAQLAESLTSLQIQMNKRLMNAMSDDRKEDAENGYNFQLGRLLLAGSALSENLQTAQNTSIGVIDSSNNRQTNQNNDVFKIPEDLDLIINQAAETHGVESALIKSVIKVESNFNPNSTSPKGAMGLMQLMPDTAKDLGVRNAYDPVENVQAGTRYLKTLLNRYDGNVDMALAAYNWGMGNVEKRPGKMPDETQNYIKNITRYYDLGKV